MTAVAKVYLAGKMSDWRKGIVFPAHIDLSGPLLDYRGHSETDGHKFEGHGYDGGSLSREAVVKERMREISSSSLLFAFIENTTAYGTLAEIGYAYAKGIPIVIVFADSAAHDDLWFAGQMAGERYFLDGEPDLQTIFSRVLQHRFPPPCISEGCESPIEKAFVKALLHRLDGESCGDWTDGGNPLLAIQTPCGSYRIDVTLVKGDVKLAIELDGHEWHERTKEQAAKDKARDRYLQTKGWRVFRFTGSEVHANADECALEMLRSITELHTGAAQTNPPQKSVAIQPTVLEGVEDLFGCLSDERA